MIQDIHKKVLKRLAYGWLSLSILIGGVVFYIEMEKVDSLVLRLAKKESETFTAENLRYFNWPDAGTSPLREKAEEFLKSHFIIIELYDRDKKIILEVMDPGKEMIEKELTQHAHRFPLSDTTYYRKFYINQQLFLQVLLPLKETSGKLDGYFEGVYQVDEETLQGIKRDVVGSLLLVIVVTLVTSIVLYPIIISLNKGLIKLSSDLLEGNIQLMEVLGSAIAKRDSDTNVHNYRVTLYTIRLAETLHLESAQIRSLIAGAFLHDVGKIGISDTILLKQGPLSDEEFKLMRNHVLLGMDIIQKSNWLRQAGDVVEFHHEKFDGSGYLRGLKGKQIPLLARIFAVVDVFDALSSRRPYKEAFDLAEVMRIMRSKSGTHFDPHLLNIFNGIAEPLYAEIGHAGEERLTDLLNGLIRRYFSGPSPYLP